MKFEGYNTRELTEQKNISFLFKDSFVSDVSGDVAIGFHGEGKTLQFKLQKGKIYDPEGNYVYSYTPLDKFTLSGDISEDYYNYSINDVSVAKGRPKNNFKIEDFFINTTPDTEFNTSLTIYSDGIDYDFTLQDTVVIGETVTGQLTNNSSDGKLIIYSSTLKNQALKNYSITSAPWWIYPASTGDFTFDSSGATSGTHAFEMSLDTNIGSISIKDSIRAEAPVTMTVLNKLEEWTENASQGLTFDTENSEETVYYLYNSTIFASAHLTQDATVSLEYVEGNVGNYYRVTGINITDSGTGYTEAPTVTFEAGQGNDVQAEGVAIITGGGVSDVTITKPGIYYNTPPTITFSGTSTTSAQGDTTTETYQKTFSECWDMYTGLSLNSLENDNYTEGSGIYTSSNPFSLESGANLYIGLKAKSFYDFDDIKVKLKITGTLEDSNTNKLIEEVTISSANTST